MNAATASSRRTVSPSVTRNGRIADVSQGGAHNQRFAKEVICPWHGDGENCIGRQGL